MIYMIFEISCWILEEEKNSFNSHFFKTVFLGIIDFWLKIPKKYKSCSKNSQNHQVALLSFTFPENNSLFDVNLFLGPLTWNCP